MESQTKQCQNCKQDFVIEPDDFTFYEKMKVPAPTFCPICRAERRLVFRNERKLYKVKDAFTGKDIFSLYPAQSGKKVTLEEEWFKDTWNASDYGRDYNFAVNFFDQLKDLEKEVPVFAQRVEYMVDSPYCANATALKNCYLVFNSSYSEDSMYGNAVDYSKNCIDNSHISKSEKCYECFWLQNCYQCCFTIMSAESRNLYFCRDCLGCSDCFGCANLRNASYCIFNKQYTQEDYAVELKKMELDTISGIKRAREAARNFWRTQPTKYHQGLKNVNSTGSYVTNCKNVNDSFLIREGENMRYCQYMQVPKSKDCYDTSAWGHNTELNYETCLCGGNSYNMKFSNDCWPNCKNLEYCISMFSSSDCFGCVGMKKQQYCILNKQYTKEDYFTIVEKIKRQMNEMPYIDKKGRVYKYGEFFPIEFAPFGYNNSTIFQYLPMTKEKAEENGYPWIEVERGKYNITEKASELPNSINDANESILEEVIECGNCKNPYRILKDEFNFYKQEKIPLPTWCDECRFRRRTEDRLKFELYNRACMCAGEKDETGKYKNNVKHFHEDGPCNEKFKTGYSPEKGEIVYCERCYQQEVY
jgi:hypothetical protein